MHESVKHLSKAFLVSFVRIPNRPPLLDLLVVKKKLPVFDRDEAKPNKVINCRLNIPYGITTVVGTVIAVVVTFVGDKF